MKYSLFNGEPFGSAWSFPTIYIIVFYPTFCCWIIILNHSDHFFFLNWKYHEIPQTKKMLQAPRPKKVTPHECCFASGEQSQVPLFGSWTPCFGLPQPSRSDEWQWQDGGDLMPRPEQVVVQGWLPHSVAEPACRQLLQRSEKQWHFATAIDVDRPSQVGWSQRQLS